VFYVKLYVHSLVDNLKWLYENARCYNKIYEVICSFVIHVYSIADFKSDLILGLILHHNSLIYLSTYSTIGMHDGAFFR